MVFEEPSLAPTPCHLLLEVDASERSVDDAWGGRNA